MAQSSETSILNTSVGDQSTGDDTLGFTPYVTAVAEFLTNDQTKPPLTMSIEGEWGSGKSSFMKQLQKEIILSKQKALAKKIDNFEKETRRKLFYFFHDYEINEDRYKWLDLSSYGVFRVIAVLWVFSVSPYFNYLFFKNIWEFLNQVSLWIIDKILSGLLDFYKSIRFLLQRKPRTVWFNAWRHDKAEALWAAFALEFIRQISINRHFSDILPTFIGHCKLFKSRFDFKDGWLDFAKKIAQLTLVLSAVILFLLFTFSGGQQWVNQLSTQVNNLNTALENKSNIKQSPETKSPSSQEESKPTEKKPPSEANKVGKLPKTLGNDLFSRLFGFVGFSGSGLVVFSLLKQLQKLVGDPKKELTHYLNSPNYQGQVSFVEKFHADFAKIVRAYCGTEKIYVFIDDLDRCELAKSAELMQALNLMISEDPSIVFLLGMDREKVAAGLAVKYKDLMPYLALDENLDDEKETGRSGLKGLEYAYAFIEKFIQIPFIIPQPSMGEFDVFLVGLTKKASAKPSLFRQVIIWGQKVKSTLENLPTIIQKYFTQKLVESISLRKAIILFLVYGKLYRLMLVFLQLKPDRKLPQATDQTSQEVSKPKPSRRQRLKLLATEDSQTIRQMVEMVASALDYNPRRLKQFINLFRLKAYIAGDTGLFDEVVERDHVINRPLELEQLGKFTAISLKWPLLIADLENHPTLLARLETDVSQNTLKFWQPDAPVVQARKNLSLDALVNYWSRRAKLRELLAYGWDKATPENYSFLNLEVMKLLQVSPKGGRKSGEINTFIEDFGNDCWLKMVEIPDGKFLMGSPETELDRLDWESPQYEVTVSSFFIAEFPVTQAQWREIASLRPIKRDLNPDPSYFKGDLLPVETVCWDDAIEFCARLSRLTKKKYRLPTEAEWEYACRAGTTTRYYFGEKIDKSLVNYDKNVGEITYLGTYPVNAFGLQDMHGNVSEWCDDSWHDNYENVPIDGSSWNENHPHSSVRVVRGGSWYDSSEVCRSASRAQASPNYRYFNIGFRVVCAVRGVV